MSYILLFLFQENKSEKEQLRVGIIGCFCFILPGTAITYTIKIHGIFPLLFYLTKAS